MNNISEKCGHVKRQLNAGQPLHGKVLEFALEVVGNGGTGDALLDGIAKKLAAGEQLGDRSTSGNVERASSGERPCAVAWISAQLARHHRGAAAHQIRQPLLRVRLESECRHCDVDAARHLAVRAEKRGGDAP